MATTLYQYKPTPLAKSYYHILNIKTLYML
ncbi:hypothetical protein F383_38302 [Gossypium arboreum]|uniref:Uncharacterized protein n=1 Tax=Gossypium arboreum TaxID=29729 RepID=A0A0B0MEX7_GOSAR|nr:hypothetical protein F383_38302 [Gossypium arboreum]